MGGASFHWVAPLRHAFLRNGDTIAQSRWLRWVIWRSLGFAFGTELGAPAGPKRALASMLCLYSDWGRRETTTPAKALPVVTA